MKVKFRDVNTFDLWVRGSPSNCNMSLFSMVH